MPAGGELHFHLLKGGDAKQVVAPEIDDCVKKSAPIVGPSEKLKNKWVGALESLESLLETSMFYARKRLRGGVSRRFSGRFWGVWARFEGVSDGFERAE